MNPNDILQELNPEILEEFSNTELETGYDPEEQKWEVIVKYSGDLTSILADMDLEIEILNESYAIITLTWEQVSLLYLYPEVEYVELPKNMSLSLTTAIERSCVAPVHSSNGMNLKGRGVAVGFIDSGIDYRHPDFINEDGTTRILYLWDQTRDGTPPEGFFSGTEYTAADINRALQSEDPASVIPNMDPYGHGTNVAGIAVGNGRASNGDKVGVAPEASLIVVKMGDRGRESFARTTELMRGIKYILEKAENMNIPVAVNISFGSNDGSHDGSSLLENYINDMAQKWKNVIVVASGNEGSAGHHYNGAVQTGETVTVEFVTSGNFQSMYISLWKNFVDIFSFELITPSGESSGTIRYTDHVKVVHVEDTSIFVYYGQPSHYNPDQEVFFQFKSQEGPILQGLWQIRVTGETVVDGRFEMWMPTVEQISSATSFSRPTVTSTLTLPSTAINVITVGGYDHLLNSPSNFSGRGYTRNDVYIKPDLVAPAVNILASSTGGGYSMVTGTSAAAPFVSGAAALMMEWGIINNNDPFLYGQRIKAFLLLGARRIENLKYPNQLWGYGSLCLENTMNFLEEYMVNTTLPTFVRSGGVLPLPDLMRETPPGEEESIEAFIARPDTVDFLAKYTARTQEYIANNPYLRLGTLLPAGFAVLYAPQDKMDDIGRQSSIESLNEQPQILGLMDRVSLEASGITQVHQQPYLDLRGRGVLLGFIDTGIDYTLDAFRYEDGTSKIQYIWDQTIAGNPPADLHFGSEYSNAQINEALSAENPFDIVPHRDTDGHGTFIASLAGSRETGEYTGGAPDAEIVMVKLKKAHPYYLEKYLVPPDQENAFEATSVILAIKFILDKSVELNRPVAICISLGSNFGSHDGFSLFEEYLSTVSKRIGVALCVAAGNESHTRHHTEGLIPRSGEPQNIEIKVGENGSDILLHLWNAAADRVSVAVKSPSGEVVGPIPARSGTVHNAKLVLERSSVIIEYLFPVPESGSQLSIIKILNPTPGIWQVVVYGDFIIDGSYHAWLPITGFISPEVEFLTPTPNYTITSPGTAIGVITVGAYNGQNNSLYISTSWGPTRLPAMSPDFVAPGVNVGGIYPTGTGVMTGTSVAASIATAACALMLQWGIVEKNDVNMNNYQIRSYLIRGCDREESIDYPSLQWGYGRLNLIQAFNLLRQT